MIRFRWYCNKDSILNLTCYDNAIQTHILLIVAPSEGRRALVLGVLTRFTCATLERYNQTIWVAHWWRRVTQNTWSGKCFSRTMVWTMVALQSDQRTMWHYSLTIGRTNFWTMVALRSDQRPKSGHKLPQNLPQSINRPIYLTAVFLSLFLMTQKKIAGTSKRLFVFIFISSFFQSLSRKINLFNFKLSSI